MASVTIPLDCWERPPLTGNRTRGNPHARANEVKAAKEQAIKAVEAAGVAPMPGANITLHFRPATRHRRDADGLFPTLKVVQDAIVLCGVLHEDSWITIPSATCRIHPPNGEPSEMWVELEELVA